MSQRRYWTAATTREVAARLSLRDWSVIHYVSGLRFVSGNQLTRLTFAAEPNPTAAGRAARRALHRLAELDVLARLPRSIGGTRSGSSGFVYFLTVGGQRLAATRGWQPERPRRRSLLPGTLFVRHALAVAELHTQLTEADRSCRFELLELSAEPTCWRRYGGIGDQRACLKSDSFVRLGVGEFEESAFIEVDRGTEGSRAIERQLAQYAAYRASGVEQQARGVFPRVLWLTTTDERAAAIRGSIDRQPSHARELFRVDLLAHGVDPFTSSFADN